MSPSLASSRLASQPPSLEKPMFIIACKATWIRGSGGLAGDDEHGLLQRRWLARQPARGQGRGHRQGARHPPTGQEVDSGTSLGSLSTTSLWSCLLETNPYIYLGASIGRAPTLCCHCLKHKWSRLYLHWYLCRD